MFFLMSGNNNAQKEKKAVKGDTLQHVRDVFLAGRFPVVTTPEVEGRRIYKVLGLVCCRGFDSEEAFFGMAARAMKKGAQAIVGYSENVAFHPDGSKYFSCYGTAVMFEYSAGDKEKQQLLMAAREVAASLSVSA